MKTAPAEDRDHRFALLEARHVDKLTESVVTLNRNVVTMNAIGRESNELGKKLLAAIAGLSRLLESAGATTPNGGGKTHRAPTPSEAEYAIEARGASDIKPPTKVTIPPVAPERRKKAR